MNANSGRHIGLVAVVGLLAVGAPAAAQRPLSVGTAAGLGATAVTESRRADAVDWNPGLVGVYDGPQRSFSLLQVDLTNVPGSQWASDVGSLGLAVDGRRLTDSRWVDALTPNGTTLQGMMGGVVWGAFQAKGLAITLGSNVFANEPVPGLLAARLVGRAPTAADAASAGAQVGDVFRSASTVLAVSSGSYLGRLPLVGGTWLGATVKGWYLHDVALGRFTQAGLDGDAFAPGGFYAESQLQRVPGYGVDVGVVFNPVRALRLGVSASNVYSGVARPKNGARTRTLFGVQSAGGSTITQELSPYLVAGDPGYDAADRLWSNLNYPSVLRAGGAVDLPFVTVAGAYEDRLSDGMLEPTWALNRWTASVSKPMKLPVSAHRSWGTGYSELGGALTVGGRGHPVALGFGRRQDDRLGTSYSLSLSVTVTDFRPVDVR